MSDPQRSLQTLKRSAELVREFQGLLETVEADSQFLQVATPAGREWHEVLRQKLIPQLGGDSWLVVAVVGGTNIGKSVIFNHLAGSRASASSPLASGTKHPVCLIPTGFESSHHLPDVFPDFQLSPWSEAKAALEESSDHRLYWRTEPELPSNLIVLDTPDIDSDARINWIRADAIRRCADVLIAVLTQQKYNDAAVKEFFRKAAAEGKTIIVVFNQCLIPDDEPYWPIWLTTFCRETGVNPELVYLTPNDRRAAEDLRLPFYLRAWPHDASSASTADQVPQSVEFSLRRELAGLRFAEIRMKSLRGSLNEVLHPERGASSWLNEIRMASSELASTAERLSNETVLRIRNWPSPANSVMVAEIRRWWSSQQEGWARRVNQVYNTLGEGILWPVRALRNAVQGEPAPPMDSYREREWEAILTVVEEMFEKLQWMADSGNRLIKPRIESVLDGKSRLEFLAKLKERHDAIPLDAELSSIVDSEMKAFRANSPELFQFYRQLNNATAAVRPMTSVVLFTLGFGPAGEAVAPFVAGAAAQAVVHVVADVAGGATAALAGEAAVSGAASTGAGILQTWFHRLHSAFMARRAGWLTEFIHKELLGSLPEDLQAASRITHTQPFVRIQQVLTELRQLTLPLEESGGKAVQS